MAEPKVRFMFDDGSMYPEWKEEVFSQTFVPLNNNTFSRDMLNYTGDGVKNIHYGDVLVKFGDICDVQKETIPVVNDDQKTDRYARLQDGDIILADTAEDDTVGKAIEICNVENEDVISGLHTMACRPIRKYATGFLGHYINSPAFHNQLRPFMQGIKVTSIGRANIAEVLLKVPSHIEEQEKLATFFTAVDDILYASEKEIENLEIQKKVALKRIFSQEARFLKPDGSPFPEWQDIRFGDIFTEIVRKTSDTETYPLYSLTIEDGVTAKTERYERSYLVKKAEDNYKIVPPNAFVYNPMNLRFGALAPSHENNEVCVSQYYNVFSLNKEMPLGFWEHYLVSDAMLQYYFSIATGSLVEKLRVHYSNFVNIVKPIPCAEEQRLIADFLSDFDEAIAAAKHELELWKELKKGLLQQMFV